MNPYLRRASMEDADLLLQWRNDPLTRAMFINGNAVARDHHLRWLESVLKDPQRHLYIAVMDADIVGTVRVDVEEDGCGSLSYATDPKNRGRGVATEMLKLVSSLHPNLKAEIKKDNLASIKAARNAGFVWSHENGEMVTFTWRRS